MIEKINSKARFKGLLKKMVMIGLVVLAYQIYLLFEGKFAIKSLIAVILISNEGLSILENASICRISIPKKLKKVLSQYQEYKKKYCKTPSKITRSKFLKHYHFIETLCY